MLPVLSGRIVLILTSGSMLIIILGLPGTGKTYFAQRLAGELKVPHFSTGQVRTELHLKGHHTRAAKQIVYNQLLIKAILELDAHPVVIVDATFGERDRRDQFGRAMVRKQQPLFMIEIVAEETIIRERVSRDREANFGAYLKMVQQFEPLADDEPHLTLDSGQQSPEAMVSQALSYLAVSP